MSKTISVVYKREVDQSNLFDEMRKVCWCFLKTVYPKVDLAKDDLKHKDHNQFVYDKYIINCTFDSDINGFKIMVSENLFEANASIYETEDGKMLAYFTDDKGENLLC